MSEIVKNRSEIVFLYDIKDGNPNGDPADENKPRIDEETGINIVTDVRLKRTIRDYLINFKGYSGNGDKDIFVREICYNKEKGYIQDGKMRAKDYDEDPEKILNKCIDIRLFGGVIPLEKASITYTGPVQFKMGRSLHKVVMKHIKGTGAFASGPEQTQATFREEDILDYSLICFYGVVNENAAERTKLTEDDIKLLLEGMWNGTRNLLSRTKAGQMPRLLLKVNYSDVDYHIGDLDKLITKSDESLSDEKIRGIPDIVVNVSDLVKALKENNEKIASINYKVDNRIRTMYEGEEKSLRECLEETGIELSEITFSGE